jgi:hypothetical protein
LLWAVEFGWQAHAERKAQFRDGTWATHVHGHAGFYDLVLIKPPRVLFWEAKVGRDKPSPRQDVWLQLAALCPGVEVAVVRPEQWSQILVTLSKP